jgi:phosphoesterase RecJ-like protein
MITNTSISNIISIIDKNKKFVVLCHVRPDGDTIGSGCAIYNFLININKDVILGGMDNYPKYLSFLPNINNYKTFKSISEIKDISSRIIICVDTAIHERSIRDLFQYVDENNIYNIDHHIDNRKYGNYYIDENSSSCAEIIYDILKKYSKYNILKNKDIITCIYTGIVTDTSNFTNSNTNKNTLHIANILINNGVKPEIINKNISIDINSVELESIIYKNKKIINNICSISYITLADQLKYNTEISCSLFANKLLRDDSILISIVISEELNKSTNKNQLKISIRTKYPYCARDIAIKLHGGGHDNAAGALAHMNIKSCISLITSIVKNHIDDIELKNSSIAVILPSDVIKRSTGYWSKYIDKFTLIPNTYLSSDHHFGHNNIIKYAERPFKNIHEMEIYYIEEHNKVISKTNSIWICLGDFVWYIDKNYDKTKKEVKRILELLNGETKILLMGNHDKLSAEDYIECGFDRVYGKNEEVKVLYKGRNIILKHKPPEFSKILIENDINKSKIDVIDISNIKNLNSNNYNKYDYELIHGHIHQLYKHYAFGPFTNVCVDALNGKPINIYDILK